MAWMKFDDQVPCHPKILKAGPTAGWLWFCGISYASRHLTDGFVPAEALQTFAVPGAQKLAETLVSVGLWESAEGGYQVHDYHEHNPTAAEVKAQRKQTAARVSEWKAKKGAARTQKERGGNAVTTPLPSRSENVPGTPGERGGNAPPTPTPTPTPTPVQRETPPPPVAMPRLVDTSHRNHASCGRVCVPAALHEEFRRKWGGDHDRADAELRAWYGEVHDAWSTGERAELPIGDDNFAFWRARFLERGGSTVRPVRACDVEEPTDIARITANLRKRGVI